MPPKKPGTGGEKKKLSKAEKEKLKLEDEAKKAEEEEEAKIRQAEEEMAQKEREQMEASERKKLENEEKKNRSIEMTELRELVEGYQNELQSVHDERRKNAKWFRYMRCDGSPDPTVPGEINTYINLRLEDTEHTDIDTVLKHCDMDTTLINELKYLLTDTPPEELSQADIDHCHTTTRELQSLMSVKLDSATLRLLQEATERADAETQNLQYMIKNEDICLCIWGNLSKNPRIKSFEFTEKGYSFEIPRILTLSDCSIRVLFTKYDHYSPMCKSTNPRPKVKEVEAPPVEEEKEEEKVEEEEKEAEAEEEEEEEMDLMATLAQLEKEQAEENEEKVEEKEEEIEEEMDEYIDPTTPEPQEFEDFEDEEDAVDLRAWHVVGGVFHFDLMELPPQPKTVKAWVITKMVDPPEIQLMEYVADQEEKKEGQSASGTAQNSQAQSQESKRDEKPPIGVTMRLPEDVLFCEEPQIARWDATKSYWSIDGFAEEKKYDEDNRTFSFKTNLFGAMSLQCDAHINMPFQSWELRPHTANSAVFTIIAAIIEVEIEIKDAMCCLSKPDDKPELSHVLKKWVTPRELVRILRQAGINLFPAEDSSKYVSIQNKHPLVEDRCYQEFALAAPGMAFAWSKYNSEVQDREKILFQAAEALEDEALLEEEWVMYLTTKKRSVKLKMTEFDETYSEDVADGTYFKSNLYHLLMQTGSEALKERINSGSHQFIDCVHQLLCATKVLTFA